MEGPPDVAHLSAACQAQGLVYEASEATVPLWRDHVQVVELFAAMQTQWLVGPGGIPALNYEALPVVERRIGIAPRRAKAVFADLRVMEREGSAYLLKHQPVLH